LTSIGDGLSIYSHPALTNLTGLEGLNNINGDLWIQGNTTLTSLTGLDNLTSIGRYLDIEYNNALTNLTGLDNLTSIGEYLYIYSNSALTSLTGLDNIDAGSLSGLYIGQNSNLSTCAIQSICDYLKSPSGTIYISENATGCNSPEEVDSACAYLTIGRVNLQDALTLYPNPASTEITIETPATGQLSILNLNGQPLITSQVKEAKTVVDISTLPSGIYVVKVVGEKGVQLGKFIKQ
jgi:hypothetical protein